ncbi:hypothetical protein [Streptomyces sp. NPDC002889]|uniref:hypothetical protein n=1 Tax=Streptomyces sp. NPDC002889 TaxID=3364669 RepID=UPI00368E0B91
MDARQHLQVDPGQRIAALDQFLEGSEVLRVHLATHVLVCQPPPAALPQLRRKHRLVHPLLDRIGHLCLDPGVDPGPDQTLGVGRQLPAQPATEPGTHPGRPTSGDLGDDRGEDRLPDHTGPRGFEPDDELRR